MSIIGWTSSLCSKSERVAHQEHKGKVLDAGRHQGRGGRVNLDNCNAVEHFQDTAKEIGRRRGELAIAGSQDLVAQ